MTILATIKYDFDSDVWVAFFDENIDTKAIGETPEEAVKNLRTEATKYDLWPNEGG